jgi:3-hydroxybutyryl-CoA dehydrogenase
MREQYRERSFRSHYAGSKAEEGGNVFGLAWYRLGSGPPSQLIELVAQPRTSESVKATAIALFGGADFKISMCADRPGRIVDRLVRPYFNAALERLDDGLAAADDLKRGPIELLEETGSADHCKVSLALSEALSDPYHRPARCARVATRKCSR